MIKEAIKPNSTFATFALEFNLLVDESLAKYTSIGIGGRADLLAKPKNKNDLKILIQSARELDIPVTLFGGGTNLLITDRGIRGLVIITKQLKSKIQIIDKDVDHKIIIADAGERLSKICQLAINNSLSGLEFAAGIPGTIGGAIIMNAGAKSQDMSSIVQSVEVLDKNSFEFKIIDRKLLNFSYRHLDLSGIIVKTVIKLKNEDQKTIDRNFKYNFTRKNATQPVSYASAGCFFQKSCNWQIRRRTY